MNLTTETGTNAFTSDASLLRDSGQHYNGGMNQGLPEHFPRSAQFEFLDLTRRGAGKRIDEFVQARNLVARQPFT